MKKVLYISQQYPYPPSGGGSIKTLETLVSLAEHYQVTAVFLSDYLPTKPAVNYLQQLKIAVHIIPRNTERDTAKRRVCALLKGYLSGVPHYIQQYSSKSMTNMVRKLIRTVEPDVIHIDHISMAQYLPQKKRELWILEQHNVESQVLVSRLLHTGLSLRSLYLICECIGVFLYEIRVLRRFDYVLAISGSDLRTMRVFLGVRNVAVQPLVFGMRKPRLLLSVSPVVLFVGDMTWHPNEDAVRWLVRSIFPLVRKLIPDIQIDIVGKPSGRNILSNTPGVRYFGFAPDLSKYMNRAVVFVLPFRMGGGIRMKALTALSYGVPVVTTPEGVRGLHLRHKKECLIAHNPATFAGMLAELLRSVVMQKKLQRNGMKYLMLNHGKEQRDAFIVLYDRIVGFGEKKSTKALNRIPDK